MSRRARRTVSGGVPSWRLLAPPLLDLLHVPLHLLWQRVALRVSRIRRDHSQQASVYRIHWRGRPDHHEIAPSLFPSHGEGRQLAPARKPDGHGEPWGVQAVAPEVRFGARVSRSIAEVRE